MFEFFVVLAGGLFGGFCGDGEFLGAEDCFYEIEAD